MPDFSPSLRRKVTKRREYPGAYEINITPVMNLFICLIPFLLISAIFVQISIIETNAPSTSGAAKQSDEEVSLVLVVIGQDGFSITGSGPIMKNQQGEIKIAKKNKEYDYTTLSKALSALKAKDPKAEDMLLMSHPDIEYSVIVETMDAARMTESGDPMFPNAFFGGVTS